MRNSGFVSFIEQSIAVLFFFILAFVIFSVQTISNIISVLLTLGRKFKRWLTGLNRDSKLSDMKSDSSDFL